MHFGQHLYRQREPGLDAARSVPAACRASPASCCSARSDVPGIEIGEKTLLPADLESADEVFITSTTRNLLPVLQIEDERWDRRAREVCRRPSRIRGALRGGAHEPARTGD